MNEKIRTSLLVVLCSLFIFNVIACKTAPVIFDTSKTDLMAIDVMKTQANIALASKDITETIDDIKEITDAAKLTGVVPVTIIKYVDVLKAENTTLTDAIKTQTVILPEFNKLRTSDNTKAESLLAGKQAQYEKEKNKAAIYSKLALIATLISFVLAGVIYLPKIIKCII